MFYAATPLFGLYTVHQLKQGEAFTTRDMPDIIRKPLGIQRVEPRQQWRSQDSNYVVYEDLYSADANQRMQWKGFERNTRYFDKAQSNLRLNVFQPGNPLQPPAQYPENHLNWPSIAELFMTRGEHYFSGSLMEFNYSTLAHNFMFVSNFKAPYEFSGAINQNGEINYQNPRQVMLKPAEVKGILQEQIKNAASTYREKPITMLSTSIKSMLDYFKNTHYNQSDGSIDCVTIYPDRYNTYKKTVYYSVCWVDPSTQQYIRVRIEDNGATHLQWKSADIAEDQIQPKIESFIRQAYLSATGDPLNIAGNSATGITCNNGLGETAKPVLSSVVNTPPPAVPSGKPSLSVSDKKSPVQTTAKQTGQNIKHLKQILETHLTFPGDTGKLILDTQGNALIAHYDSQGKIACYSAEICSFKHIPFYTTVDFDPQHLAVMEDNGQYQVRPLRHLEILATKQEKDKMIQAFRQIFAEMVDLADKLLIMPQEIRDPILQKYPEGGFVSFVNANRSKEIYIEWGKDGRIRVRSNPDELPIPELIKMIQTHYLPSL